jgi:hypothetical protein
MGVALLAVGWIARDGAWPVAPTTALLVCAGAGHACGFSPLTSRLTTVVRPAQAGDLSGLVITASLAGQILGVAVFAGVYLSAATHSSAHALALTTWLLATTLLVTAVCARAARARPSRAVCTAVPADPAAHDAGAGAVPYGSRPT